MALQTPGRRNPTPLGSSSLSLARPSFGGQETEEEQQLEVGDVVTVPGDMFGLVRFVGNVRGKAGRFVGVELDRQFAARGKNDGDVEGFHYFRTQIPGAGIFLPIHRAKLRERENGDFPLTPNTTTSPTPVSQFSHTNTTTPVSKFSQTIGHAPFRPKRPSLPRPESPLRRQPHPPPPGVGLTAPTPATRQQLSASVRGSGPSKNTNMNMNLRASTTTPSRPSTAHSQTPTPRPYSRTGSRMANRDQVGTAKTTSSTRNHNHSNGSVKSFSQPLRTQSPRERASAGGQEDEILRLKTELAERDRRLAEQAANLADMDASVKELSALLPTDGHTTRTPVPGEEPSDATTAQLRQMLREKNEKITVLTSEFDAHRADFRSTLDSLEMASTETERVYEEQKKDLLAQIQAMEEQAQLHEEMHGSRKDFEDVAEQLKALEDFVQELEDGLEESRRGEAEARGEVEFLRGEVERGRSELKRERERAASHMGIVGGGGKEMEKMEDEIRGLKAIIHSFSTSSGTITPGGISEAGQDLLVAKQQLEESESARAKLENDIEQLRRELASSSSSKAVMNGIHHSRNESELTTVAAGTGRLRANTVQKAGAQASSVEATGESESPAKLFCDMCESEEHDTLDCNTFQEGDECTTDGDGGVGEDVIGGGDVEQEGAVASSSSATAGTGTGIGTTGWEDQHLRTTATTTTTTNFGGHHNDEDDGNDDDKPAPLSLPPVKFGSRGQSVVEHQQHQQQQQHEGGGGEGEGGGEKWCALCEKDGHLAYECPDEGQY